MSSLLQIEANAFAFSLDCHGRNEFTKLSLIEQRLQRSFYESLDKLLQLQKLRNSSSATTSETEPSIVEARQARPSTRQPDPIAMNPISPQPLTSEIGFVPPFADNVQPSNPSRDQRERIPLSAAPDNPNESPFPN